MRVPLALAFVLTCAACSQEDAPAEQIAEEAEQLVTPTEPAAPLAKGRFAPRDSCAKMAGADQFARRLIDAVKARDANAFAALAAEDIKLDFGGGEGTAELRARLRDDSLGLWDELDELVQLGCSANEQGGITIPWYFDQDMGAIDPFMGMLVMGEDVPVFAGPDEGSERRAAISWDVVEIAGLEPDKERQQVELPDGSTGFIATGKLRSLLDYRLIASSRNGRWRITSFLAGD